MDYFCNIGTFHTPQLPPGRQLHETSPSLLALTSLPASPIIHPYPQAPPVPSAALSLTAASARFPIPKPVDPKRGGALSYAGRVQAPELAMQHTDGPLTAIVLVTPSAAAPTSAKDVSAARRVVPLLAWEADKAAAGEAARAAAVAAAEAARAQEEAAGDSLGALQQASMETGGRVELRPRGGAASSGKGEGWQTGPSGGGKEEWYTRVGASGGGPSGRSGHLTQHGRGGGKGAGYGGARELRRGGVANGSSGSGGLDGGDAARSGYRGSAGEQNQWQDYCAGLAVRVSTGRTVL